MNYNAPGQLLGYMIQFPRMLLRLLQMKPGESVGIEVCGDISRSDEEGFTLVEEDKSSIRGKPLEDSSENLWKSFYNWIQSIQDGTLSVDRTTFILYANCKVNSPLVNRFHAVQKKEDAKNAIEEALSKMKKTSKTYKKYINVVLNENVDLFKQILIHFELVTNDSTEGIREDIYNFLREKYIPEVSFELVCQKLLGWLQEYIWQKITNNEYAIVTFDQFSQHCTDVITKIRDKVLVDYALQHLPSAAENMEKVKTRPTFVQQLEIISLNEDKILEAVSDYFRAKYNRIQWIKNAIIDESDMEDFQARLLTYHGNSRQKIELTEENHSEEKRGLLLLLDCYSRQECLADQTPPDKTISGTYHVLADECQLGWHPHWKDKIQTMEKKEEEKQ